MLPAATSDAIPVAIVMRKRGRQYGDSETDVDVSDQLVIESGAKAAPGRIAPADCARLDDIDILYDAAICTWIVPVGGIFFSCAVFVSSPGLSLVSPCC
jgi:hypothetical protein